MATYTIEPERGTLHGHFSRTLPPVLTIDPRDTVRFRTLEAGWNLEPPLAFDRARRKFAPLSDELDSGHALCGPVAIRGARPGMVLAVRIEAIQTGNWGLMHAGGWPSKINSRLGIGAQPGLLVNWTLDPEALVGRNQYGHTVALRPFMGVMGMPPDEPGIHPTAPPRFCGGNIDCKELIAGSTLYLPIAVPEALFSVGDGHAAQGDGEVAGAAIECPMERVDLSFDLRDDLRITTPCANTPAGWVTCGFHSDLEEAAIIALHAMLNLLNRQYGLARREALALAGVVVDMRITQVVNGVLGVHALLPHGAIT